MTTWISVDADWICGDSRAPGDVECVGCSWRARCWNADMPTDPRARGTGKAFSDVYDLPVRTEELSAMLRKVGVARAVVRECHASISRFLHAGDVVYHIDDHGDDDDEHEKLNCGNWRCVANARGVRTISAEPCEVARSGLRDAALFICLSRPYTRAEVDGYVFRLLHELPCRVDFDLTR